MTEELLTVHQAADVSGYCCSWNRLSVAVRLDAGRTGSQGDGSYRRSSLEKRSVYAILTAEGLCLTFGGCCGETCRFNMDYSRCVPGCVY